MKRFALLLFAGLFGFATLQTASAQEDENSHQVNINVNSVTKITVENDVDVDIDELNNWTGSSSTDFTVATNTGEDMEVTARVTGNQDGLDDLRLRVSAKDLSSGSGETNVELSSGSDELVASDFNKVKETGTLEYQAQAAPSYGTTDDARTVEVNYTFTKQ